MLASLKQIEILMTTDNPILTIRVQVAMVIVIGSIVTLAVVVVGKLLVIYLTRISKVFIKFVWWARVA